MRSIVQVERLLRALAVCGVGMNVGSPRMYLGWRLRPLPERI
jgi:hypothetical protein